MISFVAESRVVPSPVAPSRARRVLSLALVALLALSAPVVAKKGKKGKKPTSKDELFNPLLGVDYCQWLVGPIARIASLEEIERYLQLVTDQEADAFVTAFWAARNEGTPVFQQKPEDRFKERVAEADKRFSEAAAAGSMSARGTIFVVYGEPQAIFFEEPRVVGDPSPEVWEYPKDAPPGLDGEVPERRYRFIKLGDHTVFYEQKMRRDPRLRDPLGPNRSRNRPFD